MKADSEPTPTSTNEARPVAKRGDYVLCGSSLYVIDEVYTEPTFRISDVESPYDIRTVTLAEIEPVPTIQKAGE